MEMQILLDEGLENCQGPYAYWEELGLQIKLSSWNIYTKKHISGPAMFVEKRGEGVLEKCEFVLQGGET